MELFIAEYQRAFGEKKSRLIVFQAPNRATAKAVANSRAEKGELLYGVVTAGEALDFDIDFIHVQYKRKPDYRTRKRYRRFKKKIEAK
jgi:hypothetical protein